MISTNFFSTFRRKPDLRNIWKLPLQLSQNYKPVSLYYYSTESRNQSTSSSHILDNITDHFKVKELFTANHKVGHEVNVSGWVKSKRKQKDICFLQINDGSVFKNLQVIASREQASNVKVGESVNIKGILKQSMGSQYFELDCLSAEVIGTCATDFPVVKNKSSVEHLRPLCHIRSRSLTFSSILRFRSAIQKQLHDSLYDQGYMNIQTPILTTNDCEGGGEMFSVNSPLCNKDELYFDNPVFLTVSGQLHLEAMCCGLDRVYTMGPAFRAENSNTGRHLSEFIMLEAELAFTKSIDDVMKLVFSLYKSVIDVCLSNKLSDELHFLTKANPTIKENLEKYQNCSLIKITYSEAIDILKSHSEFSDIEFGNSLNTQHEKYLVDVYNNGLPMFVTHYPITQKAFYCKDSENGEVSESFDFLVPGVAELAGGTLREENYEILKKKMKNRKMKLAKYDWYLDLRRYGSAPHGGFGLGVDRLIQHVLGLNNIRDVVPFYRARNSCFT